jgi:hypothetical protein
LQADAVRCIVLACQDTETDILALRAWAPRELPKRTRRAERNSIVRDETLQRGADNPDNLPAPNKEAYQ